MAIILIGLTDCSLCKKKLLKDDIIVATSHFISDPNDPLWKYSDSAMHQACFASWDQRDAFRNKFNSCGLPWVMDTAGRLTQKGTTGPIRCVCSPADLFNYGCKCGSKP
jgi:hypothetical protein